ncbi:hypothetical protein EMIHUDRAFT_113732 [Emiliania huxleyi CCMP1516]|uniref:ABC1 atypical kinase-like domain-containing protein n=2 Tax=Emiliania huxleyi TaxID=2903 RepID=A0A0D3K172_EMIH1|nr:hypothetical protein EMIHUDRAFT_113732 [Emiliania huxleyi CCMP1516]EOD29507.1 hypothetical protein EMIHUDRAFT_113732 [Emiliania huxleyi CCMP1516]|eukprot:XP_005781936.1 hypothetical protein EMIHUDRAFT_113732 [Emiliania huxleyi CCMP1516]
MIGGSLRHAARRLRAPALAVAGCAAGTSLYLRGADEEFRHVSESELPTTYDPEAFAAVWSAHPRCCLARLREIVARVAPLAAVVLRDSLRGGVPGESEAERDARYALRARELRGCLTDLGPTFIKAGQALSIRPDVLPPPAVYELQKLCDAVPSYPTAAALALIEAELGAPASSLFELDASSEPIAAASLGQVYRCRLREGGAEVALKVQRPDMIRAVSLDLYLLRRYCLFVEWFKVRVLTNLLGAAERTPFDVALLDTFARASYLELDYRHEAANLERFRTELLPRLGSSVYVPRSYPAVTTRKVLATEWIEGEQLARSPPEVINRLIATGVDCFISQLLDVGFFHSDPHPGDPPPTPTLPIRHLTSAIVNLMRGDVEGLVNDASTLRSLGSAITLRFLPPDVDREALLPPLRRVFEQGRLAAATQASESLGGGGRRRGGGRAAQYSAAAYPLAAQHAARLFGAKQLASMLGEAKAAERSWRALLRRESRQPRGQLPSVEVL